MRNNLDCHSHVSWLFNVLDSNGMYVFFWYDYWSVYMSNCKLSDMPLIAYVVADRCTYLPWLVSRSAVDTLYWTETVMTSWFNVVDGVEGVCVLIWLVVYSRGVVYVTELMSAAKQEQKLPVRWESFHPVSRLARKSWPRGGDTEGRMKVKGIDWMVKRGERRYLRVRRPAVFTRA